MANRVFFANALTGGSAGTLDDIDHTALADNNGAIVIDMSNGVVYFYKYDSSSSASESSPDVIQPDSNSGNGRWLLIPDLDLNGDANISGTLTLSKASGNGLVVTSNADINGNEDLAGTLDIGASTTRRVGPAGTYVNAAGGQPVVSATAFDIDANVTQGSGITYYSIGPTGSGADHIWTALDSVPTDADYIWIRYRAVGGDSPVSFGGHIDIWARKNGSSSTGIENIVARNFAVYDYASSTDQLDIILNIPIPVSSGVFDMSWVTTLSSVDAFFYLIGWGFNPPT